MRLCGIGILPMIHGLRIPTVVILLEEGLLASVSSLRDVVSDSRNHHARKSSHVQSLPKLRPSVNPAPEFSMASQEFQGAVRG